MLGWAMDFYTASDNDAADRHLNWAIKDFIEAKRLLEIA